MNDHLHFDHTPGANDCAGCGAEGAGQFTLTRNGLTASFCTRCTIAGFDRIAFAARLRMEGVPRHP